LIKHKLKAPRSKTCDFRIKNAVTVRNIDEFKQAVKTALAAGSVAVIVAKLEPGEEPVPLPQREGRENRYEFVRYIERTENIRIINPYARQRKKDLLSQK
jgi:hypothetical protein